MKHWHTCCMQIHRSWDQAKFSTWWVPWRTIMSKVVIKLIIVIIKIFIMVTITTVDNCDEYQTVGFETGQVTQRTHASVEKDDQHCQHCHQYIFLIVFMMVRTLITGMYIIFLCHNCCGEKSAYFPPNDNNNDNFILYFNYDLLWFIW